VGKIAFFLLQHLKRILLANHEQLAEPQLVLLTLHAISFVALLKQKKKEKSVRGGIKKNKSGSQNLNERKAAKKTKIG
jgi:hypothetical protein